VTILLITVTGVIVVVTIHIVVTIETSPQQFWFAEAILTKRFAEATKSFSP